MVPQQFQKLQKRRRYVCSTFPGDPRIHRQSDALTDAGYEVDVFALRRPGEAAEERAGALRIVRLPLDRTFGLAQLVVHTAAPVTR